MTVVVHYFHVNDIIINNDDDKRLSAYPTNYVLDRLNGFLTERLSSN